MYHVTTDTTMLYLNRSPYLLLLGLALLVSLTACDSVESDDPQPQGVAQWEGAYTGQARFGGSNGRWGNGGTYRLIVSANGQVTINGSLIQNSAYDPETNSFEWAIADDNATSGGITFSETSSHPDFADIGTGTVGQSFTGFIRKPGEGPLDYRGILD